MKSQTRIIKEMENGKVFYKAQRKFLFFFWTDWFKIDWKTKIRQRSTHRQDCVNFINQHK